MINSYFRSSLYKHSTIQKIVPKIWVLIVLLPNILSAGLTGLTPKLHLPFIKSRQFDLSTIDSSSDSLDESNNAVNQPPSASDSATYGLPRPTSYTESSSSLDLHPGGSIVQSNHKLSPPSYYPSPNHAPMINQLPNPLNDFGQTVRAFNSFSSSYRPLTSHNGYSPPAYGRYPVPLRGQNPYYRNRLRRNGSKSRYGKRRYSKRFRRPYYHGSSRRYRSSRYSRYRSPEKYNIDDYDYDHEGNDLSMMASESSPSQTLYSSNGNSKDYLKIGGIGNNIISYLASSLFNRSISNKMIVNNSTSPTINNSSLDASKESTNDGPFIQFGETKITLMSNDKGGITVTVGKSKL